MALTYAAKLVRQTRNYLVYEYGANQFGNPFALYVPKADLPVPPPRATKITVEPA
jgi:hypothetical protein